MDILQSIMESSSQAMFILNTGGDITHINQNAHTDGRKLLGLQIAVVIPQKGVRHHNDITLCQTARFIDRKSVV